MRFFKKTKVTPVDIEDKLDMNNQQLLQDIRSKYFIQFKSHNQNYEAVHTINQSATIYYNPLTFSNDSIAHELLHVWLKTFGCLSSNHIYIAFKSDTKFNQIFSKNLCDHIGNCQEHLKIYPRYIKMGYSPNLFIRNAKEEQCPLSRIDQLVISKDKFYSSHQLNLFIGYLISIYAHHIKLDYSTHLSLLEKKEPDLFKIATDFWQSWEKFDTFNIDPIFNSDFALYEDFIRTIEEWGLNKNIIT